MQVHLKTSIAILSLALVTSVIAQEPLFTRDGTDPTFAALIENGTLKPGERFAKLTVHGSRIDVNNDLLEKQVGKAEAILKDIGLHTQNSGGIPRKDFVNWTRWYQEDGNTQIFRLFKDEQNIRSGTGDKASPGRVETYSKSLTVAPGAWKEWEATYTIIDPVGANIFQLFHNGKDAKGKDLLWAFHIRMSDEGDIYFSRRRPIPGMEDRITLAEKMTGKSLSVKIRSNGHEYEVYQKPPLDEAWKLVTKGSYPKAEDNIISFRWGMYCGSKPSMSIKKDAMMFVTGATIR
ncbi:MAG: hypothetical protein V4727_02630 [Verrucomicrobiota bacterium]